MAMHIPTPPGYASMLKQGAQTFQGLEEAVFRNIDACVELAKTTRSAYGPTGQNKMVINHLDKLFVTNDAATILRELEVAHPAAKMLVLATQQQEQEAGDGTNLVFILAGAMLENAQELLQMGLSVTEVAEGYEIACKKALEILPSLVVEKLSDLRDKSQCNKAIRAAVMSKQYGNEDFLSDLITDACLATYPEKSHFNVDRVRVCKVLGSGLSNSHLLQGLVFRRGAEGEVTQAKDCKVAVFSCPIDTLQTETKGNVLIHSGEELKNLTRDEELITGERMKSIADAGAKVVVSGGKIGELALHYANKYGLLAIRLNSKFDVRRLCQALEATPLPTFTAPTAEEMGHVSLVKTDEIGETNVVIFQQKQSEGTMATIVLRGSTENLMDDAERAIDDAVNTFKCLTRDNRLLPGAGAVEMELANQLKTYSDTVSGLEQYAIKKFAQSFETPLKALAENAGIKATEILAELYAAHQKGDKSAGLVFQPEGGDPVVSDAAAAAVYDLFLVKYWAIKFATAAACTVLRVDQIIMARAAGGPKPKENKNWDED